MCPPGRYALLDSTFRRRTCVRFTTPWPHFGHTFGHRLQVGVEQIGVDAVDESTVWGLAQAKSFVVFRQPATVVADTSAFFSSDRTALRAVVRAAFAWPHQAAVIKIGVGGS